MSDAILRINNLSKTYGAKKALDGVSFEVERGKIYGFIGENGAGKTTAIRAITGLSPIENGTITKAGYLPCLINEHGQPEILKNDERGRQVYEYVENISNAVGLNVRFRWEADEVVVF